MTGTKKRSDAVINQNIRSAQTLPGEYYRDPKYFEMMKERVFARSWQFATDTDHLPSAGSIMPWNFLEGHVDEPLLFARDADEDLHCLSNVCTHRGNILVEEPCQSSAIRCRYHGRRFSCNGNFVSTPGFEGAENFPSPSDNLPSAQMELFGKFVFVAIDPAYEFKHLSQDMERRLHWLPFHKMKFVPEKSKDYFIDANWMLYVDNYLEGLHVPFVHPGLATIIDTKDYRNESHKYSNLQIGLATKPQDAFDLPADSPEAKDKVAAYYYFLFPNMMINFYAWGLSLNIVMPMSIDKTRIRFLTYVYDESKLASGALDLLDKTEYEDEAIVQLVQKGMQSRLYKRGRYSPQWESNLHHFHTLITSFIPE